MKKKFKYFLFKFLLLEIVAVLVCNRLVYTNNKQIEKLINQREEKKE